MKNNVMQMPPEAVLAQYLFGHIIQKSLGIATELGIADLISEKPASTVEIATKTQTHSESLYRVLRLLESVGCFVENSNGEFENTPLSTLLLKDSPNSMRDFVLMMSDDWSWKTVAELKHSVETGELAHEKAFGVSSWDYFEQNAKVGEIFNRAMTSNTLATVPPIVSAYDFSQFKTIADIAGGHGILLAGILEANPNLQGLLFDVPSVIAGSGEFFENADVADRVKKISGDFFKEVPSGADAYILKHIIHDWHDKESIKILQNIHSVMNENSKVLIVEMVIPESKEQHPSKTLDLQMLMFTGGKERTAKEYAELLDKAGFKMTNIIPTHSPMQIVEAVKK